MAIREEKPLGKEQSMLDRSARLACVGRASHQLGATHKVAGASTLAVVG
jgi:hypothetical protein